MNNMNRAFLITTVVCFTGLARSQLPLFQITDIPKLDSVSVMIPHDINDRGTVIGAAVSSAKYRDFVWTRNSGVQPTVVYGRDGNEIDVGSYVINNRGTVAADISYTKIFSPAIIGKDHSVNKYLKGTWADDHPQPIKITLKGDVLGTTNFTGWFWSHNDGLSPMMLGEGAHVQDVNEDDIIVGGQDAGGVAEFAFVYDTSSKSKVYIAPGPQPGDADEDGWNSRATSINDLGQATGYYSPHKFAEPIPFIWTAATGLSALSGVQADQTSVRPTDINYLGQIVGKYTFTTPPFDERFFYWDADSGKVVDVMALLDSSDPLAGDVQFAAYDEFSDPTQSYIPKINGKGQIMLAGWLKSERNHGPNHIFLLTPVAR